MTKGYRGVASGFPGQGTTPVTTYCSEGVTLIDFIY